MRLNPGESKKFFWLAIVSCILFLNSFRFSILWLTEAPELHDCVRRWAIFCAYIFANIRMKSEISVFRKFFTLFNVLKYLFKLFGTLFYLHRYSSDLYNLLAVKKTKESFRSSHSTEILNIWYAENSQTSYLIKATSRIMSYKCWTLFHLDINFLTNVLIFSKFVEFQNFINLKWKSGAPLSVFHFKILYNLYFLILKLKISNFILSLLFWRLRVWQEDYPALALEFWNT